MKKHLIAAAVAAAVSGPVAAQVTISGTFDTNVGSVDTGATTAKASTFSSGTDGLATSTIVFRGNEDLGGGLKAGFVLSNYFTTNTGVDQAVAASAAVVPNELSFDQSYVTLAGDFGQIAAGRIASNASEAWGLGRFAGNFGRLASANANVARETSNSIAYTSPTVQGVTVELFKGNETNGSTDGTTAFAIRYVNGPLAIGAGSGQLETSSTEKRKLTSFAAQYDFGMVRIGALQIAYDPTLASGTDKVTTRQFHAAAPVAKGITLHVMAGTTKLDDGSEATNSTHRGFGATYDLSKRTTAYAMMLSNDNSSGANYAIRNTTAGGNGADPKSTLVGIRHTF